MDNVETKIQKKPIKVSEDKLKVSEDETNYWKNYKEAQGTVILKSPSRSH